MSLSDSQLLSADAFGEQLVEQLHTLPNVKIISRAGLELRLDVGGRPVTSQADAFYSAYISAPDRLDEIVEAYLALIREELPRGRVADRFEQVADKVYPMLKRPDILLQVRERNIPMLAWTSFLADLVITYVLESDRNVSYINEDHLERWELGEQELHQRAVANLRQRTKGKSQVTMVGENEQRLFIYSTMDGYDATRLLLPDLILPWQEQLPGQVVIGIPNRDFLIGFSDADAGVLSAVARQVQLDAGGREHGLTEQLFTLRNGRVVEYEW